MFIDSNMNVAPCILRFALETHQEIHGITGARASIQDVADDYEPRGLARPGQLIVDDAHTLQRLDHGAVGAVNIRDGDNAISPLDVPVFCTRRRKYDANDKQAEQQGSDHSRHVRGPLDALAVQFSGYASL